MVDGMDAFGGQRADVAAGAEDAGRRRVSRVKLALAALLVLLMLLLAALGYFIVTLIAPSVRQAAKPATTPGLVWVRSLYAFGPGKDQVLQSPISVAVDDGGTIWVGDNGKNVLVAYNPDGSVRRVANLATLAPEVGHIVPTAIACVGRDVYVASGQVGDVFVLGSDGAVRRRLDVGDELFAVAVSGQRVYVGTEDGLVAYTAEGDRVGVLVERGRGEGQVYTPQDIVVLDDGRIVVADGMNGFVKCFTPEGQLVWSTAPGRQNVPGGSSGSAESTSSSGMQTPVGLAVDGNGRIVAVDLLAMELFVIDQRDGKVLARYSEAGRRDGQLFYPQEVDYDRDRDWFVVADMYNSRVQVLRIPGSGGSPIAAARRALVGPVWLCSIPLILALTAVAVALSRRRARSALDSSDWNE